MDVAVIVTSTLGMLGAAKILRTKQLPTNSFSILISILAIADFAIALLSTISAALSIVQFSPDNAVLFNLSEYFIHLMCMLGLSISCIPSYIIVYGGSIHSIDWRYIVLSCCLFSAPFTFTAIFGNESETLVTLINFLVFWCAALWMIFNFAICWWVLKKESQKRSVFRTASNHYKTELHNHQASLIMINFIRSFAIIHVLLVIPLGMEIYISKFVYATSHSIPSKLWIVLVGLSGLFHCIAIDWGLRREKAKAKQRKIVKDDMIASPAPLWRKSSATILMPNIWDLKKQQDYMPVLQAAQRRGSETQIDTAMKIQIDL